MSIKDLPIVVFSEEELKHLQQMAGGDGDECPIPLGEENENLKKMKDQEQQL